MAHVDQYSLSTASGEAATSTLSYNSNHENPNPKTLEEDQQQPPQHPPSKKKRNQPGMPDPEAEVVALSPKSLMATNRFVCEICGKGFQRDQNLQLHRRGHNLPWKLKQRGPKDTVRKRVYICPEINCVHHDPRRALGDLTGIKKHFCRKHGEKKWKCERCSKKYAVQSDWKAHLKTCGTRQYQCDCGTIFSRRDSFVTHRAFCDALAQESAKVHNLSAGSPAPASSSVVLSPVLSTSQSSEMQASAIGVTTSTTTACITSSMNGCNGNENGNVVFDNTMFAPLTGISESISQPQTLFPSLVTVHPNMDRPTIYTVESAQTRSLSPLYQFPPTASSTSPQPAMSATALLQKAAQMGASASGTSLLCGFGVAETSQTSSNSEGKSGKPENDCSAPDGLMHPSSGDFGDSGAMMGDPSGFFGSKPMTLDFLGLGIGGGASGGGALPGYLASIGSPLDMAAAFGEAGNLPSQGAWDDQAAQRKPKETLL